MSEMNDFYECGLCGGVIEVPQGMAPLCPSCIKATKGEGNFEYKRITETEANDKAASKSA